MNDTDRDLLERAAKAVGREETRVDERGWFYVCTYPGHGGQDDKEWELWNPLVDKAEALDLARRRRMVVDLSMDDRAIAMSQNDITNFQVEHYHHHGEDRAICLAIVKCAAASMADPIQSQGKT